MDIDKYEFLSEVEDKRDHCNNQIDTLLDARLIHPDKQKIDSLIIRMYKIRQQLLSLYQEAEIELE
jgi:hypothetical protein